MIKSIQFQICSISVRALSYAFKKSLRFYTFRVNQTPPTYELSLILVRRGIAAYRVGCENAKAPHIGDINDQYGDWDYSNDVISKAKYYAKNVFN